MQNSSFLLTFKSFKAAGCSYELLGIGFGILWIFPDRLQQCLNQGFPTFLLPCTPTAFQQISMYPFRISKDEHVPLKFLMTR